MIADDNPRLPFLNQVLSAVQKLPDAAVLSHYFAEYTPLPDMSLLLTHPDCDGPLVVSAVSVQGGDVVFQPFPADGKPHWRLDCESGEIFYTCDLDEAVGFVEDWLDFCQSTRLNQARFAVAGCRRRFAPAVCRSATAACLVGRNSARYGGLACRG